MRALLPMLLLAAATASQALESGAPSGIAVNGQGNQYRERRELRDAKVHDSSATGHQGRCYDNTELARILTENPDWVVMEAASVPGRPAYSVYHSVVNAQIAAIRDEFDAVEALRPGSRSRMCIGMRPDVYRKEALCVGGSNPGVTCRIGSVTDCHDSGVCQGVHSQNPSGTFQDSWVIQVPNATWTTYITNEWGSFTAPTDGTGIYAADPTWLATLQGLSGATEPEIYGDASYADNAVHWSGYVLPDVRISAYQTWFVAEAIQMMRVAHAGCLELGTKPGWWILNAGPRRPSSGFCGLTDYQRPSGGYGWQGFARNGRCIGGTADDTRCTSADSAACVAGGGQCSSACASILNPVIPTPYAAGEYESAMNAIMGAVETALATHGHCASDTGSGEWTDCQVDGDCPGSTCSLFGAGGGILHQIERPDDQDLRWHWMTSAVRSSSILGGEATIPTAPLCAATNSACSSAGYPFACCTGSGTGTCSCPDKSTCD